MFRATYGCLPSLGYDITFSVKPKFPLVPPQNINRWTKILNAKYSFAFIVITLVLVVKILNGTSLNSQEILKVEFLIVYFGLLFLVNGARLSFFISRKQASQAINFLLRKKFVNHKPKYRNVPILLDFPGLLLAYYMIGVNIFGIPMPMFICLLKLDGGFAIIETLVPNFVMSYFDYNSAFAFAIRILVQSTLTFYSLRDLSVILFTTISCYLAIATRIVFMQKILQCWSSNGERRVLSLYKELRLEHSCCQYYLNRIAFLLVLFSQIILSSFLWITLKCYNIVPVFIILTFGAAFVGGLGLTIFLLQICAIARMNSSELIKKGISNYGRSRRNYKNGIVGKTLHREWIAQQLMPIYCGGTFAFSANATLNYVNILNQNITNSVLLIMI